MDTFDGPGWDADDCLAQWPLDECTNWEVGYVILTGVDADGPNIAIAYAAFQGGCKSVLNYYVPLSRGAAPAKAPRPKAYGCKTCTAAWSKVRRWRVD